MRDIPLLAALLVALAGPARGAGDGESVKRSSLLRSLEKRVETLLSSDPSAFCSQHQKAVATAFTRLATRLEAVSDDGSAKIRTDVDLTLDRAKHFCAAKAGVRPAEASTPAELHDRFMGDIVRLAQAFGEDPALALVRRTCLERDYSAAACAVRTTPLHRQETDASKSGGVIKGFFLCVEIARLAGYAAYDKLVGSGTMKRWMTLQEMLVAKASGQKFSDCQKVALANCVAHTLLKVVDQKLTWSKFDSAAGLSEGGAVGTCTEISRFTGALLNTLGVSADAAPTSTEDAAVAQHLMLDLDMDVPGQGRARYRLEPQIPCGDGVPCHLKKLP